MDTKEALWVSTTARIQITIEVDKGVWGGDCTTQQVFDQASREAVQDVMNKLSKLGSKVRVVGKPKVIMVVAKEKN